MFLPVEMAKGRLLKCSTSSLEAIGAAKEGALEFIDDLRRNIASGHEPGTSR